MKGYAKGIFNVKISIRSPWRMARAVTACGIVLLLFPAGCAQKKGRESFFYHRTYVPIAEFSQRVPKAAISPLGDVALLKEGYVPIGTITVKHLVGESYRTDTSTEAQLSAAQNGGDLVTLEADREEREETREKRGRCLETRKQLVLSWNPERSYDEWQEVSECVSWERIPFKTRVIVSLGTVWRLEPEFLRENAPLILAEAIQDDRTAFSRALLETLRFDVDTVDRFGWTPLMYAAFHGGEGNLEIAHLLLDRGAEINRSDREGKTALMKAVMNGHEEMARFLFERGADLTARDRTGRTALDYARGALRDDISNWLRESPRE